MIKLLLVISFVVCLYSVQVQGEYKKNFAKNCDYEYSITCLKLDVVSWVDKLNDIDGYSVLPGVSIVRENNNTEENNTETVRDLAREFPNDPDARVDAFLLRRLSGFITSHSIKLKLWGSGSDNGIATARKGGGGGYGGGGGKKGDGGLGMVLAAGAMMKGTLMALALAGIAALAGKALMASLIALLLAALSGLKGGGGGGGKTTYEVVAKPVYSQSHTHSVSHEDYGGHGGGGGHSGYGRSFDSNTLPLGLQPNYKPEYS